MNRTPFHLISAVAGLLILTATAPASDKKSLSLDDAKKVLAAAVDRAKKGAGTAAIAVVDDGGKSDAGRAARQHLRRRGPTSPSAKPAQRRCSKSRPSSSKMSSTKAGPR